jgi:hypothetical protein
MMKFLALGFVLAAAALGSGCFSFQHEDGAATASSSSAGGAA